MDPLSLNVVTICDSWSDLKKCSYELPVDFVFCLGDLADSWLRERVAKIAPRYGAYGIRGNHDDVKPFPSCVRDLNFKIEDVAVGPRVLRLSGVPGSWQYKPFGHWLYYQDEMSECIQDLPHVDILLAHNCPTGIGHERRGESLSENRQSVHQGFISLNDYVAAKLPAFLFHGHQHVRKTSRLEKTTVVGCFGEDFYNITVP